jgi:hypothetical protein
LSDHINYQIVVPCVGVSGTTRNGKKEEWQWGGRSIYKYVAILQCIVTEGISFKSGKLNEQNEQLLRKNVY